MTIELSNELMQAIAQHSEQAYPNECCGIMLGEDEGEQRRVVALLPQSNQSAADEQYHRFLITPQMMLAAERAARAQRLDVIGFYHSHPEDEARPSNFDREYAWPWYSYIVARVRDHKYDQMASWRLADDRSHFTEEEIIKADLQTAGRDESRPYKSESAIRHGIYCPVFPPTIYARGVNHMATITIPTPLRQYAAQQREVYIAGSTIDELLGSLTEQYPELRRHLYSDSGTLRNFVNVYLNDEDVRYLKKGNTPVADGDTISIIPAIAGGSAPHPNPLPRGARGNSPHPNPLPRGERGQQASDMNLSHDEILRYSRHLLVPEVAMDGQKKLKAASVLLIGAGGLGSPAALYLAAAGVGRIGIVDFDVVDSTNLQRQIIHSTEAIGTSKLASAKARIEGLNPYVKVETYETMLSSANALELFKDYDIIADGTDNFPTRYLVNDACVLLGKPNVYGSIFRFEGQASVFYAKQGPCYRCLYPEPPPPGLVPSCAEGGVLGVLPGTIGLIQATETIKLILGIGEPLIGRLLLYDALNMRFRELELRKDPDCPICGEHPTISELIDYEAFCGITAADEGITEVDISPLELKGRLDRGEDLVLLDVREPHEWEIAHLEGATLIPVNEVQERAHELSTADEIVLYCKSGVRSARAVQQLQMLGFRKLHNLRGGINAWADQVDPSMPTY